MEQYDVSIIIPVYNREEIIKPCIESINAQTYDKSKWEVIFIDDASTDNSIDTIESLIDKNINCRIIRRSVGSGNASAPRNEGIKASLSKYVFFLDSDDYVDSQLLENGMAMALKNDSDMVYFKIAKSARVHTVRPFKNKLVDNADISKDHLMRSLRICKLYKTQMLRTNNILFDVTIDVFEDMLFNFIALNYSKVTSIVADRDYYCFTAHEGSHLSQKKITMDKRFAIYFSGLQILYNCDNSFEVKSKLYNSWLIRCVEHFKSVLKSNSISNKKIFDLFSNASSYFNFGKDFLDINQVYKNEKLLTLLFLSGDFKEFHKLANESKVLQPIEKMFQDKFKEIVGFKRAWVFNGKVVVLDFIIDDNKIAFDLEVDEKKKTVKIWLFSRNKNSSLGFLKESAIRIEDKKILIFEGDLEEKNKMIDVIRIYLSRIASS